MFQSSHSLENLWKAVSGLSGHKVYLEKTLEYFIFHNVFTTLKYFKTWKKSTAETYETFLIYSIKLSGLSYRIKSLSGYFFTKRKCAKKLTWMIIFKLSRQILAVVGYVEKNVQEADISLLANTLPNLA